MPGARLTTVAEFPQHYFLENLAVRADNSILVTAMNQKELWYVPAATGDRLVQPQLIHSFEHPAMAIIETGPDVFHVATSEIYTTHESFLARVDLRRWTPGHRVAADPVLTFGDRAGALNGGCLLTPATMLVADSAAGLIWRVDLSPDGGHARAEVWLKHASMNPDPHGTMKPPQPGINGIRYASRSGFVYYTSTAQKLFMRVRVVPDTLAAADPEQVGGGTMSDDFCIDEDAGAAYVTTHRQNTIDRIKLDGPAGQPRVTVAGDPLDEQLLGPSSGAWGRASGQYGKVAFFTTDGGTTAPLADGSVRTAKLLRLDLGRS